VISDPGYELVQQALAAGHQVSPIPGPSAPISALISSGLPADKFLYLGYLPRKSSTRKQFLMEIAKLPFTLIFFETPHRLEAALEDLLEVLGDREMTVGREITKLHEEFFRGTISAALAHFTSTQIRGEITLVVAGQANQTPSWSEAQVRAAIKDQKAQGIPPSQIASQVASESKWPRRKIYQMTIEMD
jgi:16S rRNA (cytidine1402-2'-O)-methyltransferase